MTLSVIGCVVNGQGGKRNRYWLTGERVIKYILMVETSHSERRKYDNHLVGCVKNKKNY